MNVSAKLRNKIEKHKRFGIFLTAEPLVFSIICNTPCRMQVFCQLHLAIYFFSGAMAFQMKAASAPPTSGPMMNTHRSAMACPPWNKAGPILRAGFTLVPVK